MPLVYRDRRPTRSTAFRLPSWLQPRAGEMQRVEDPEGDFVGFWNPLFFSVAQIPADAVWATLEDHWEVVIVQPFTPAALLSQAADRPKLLPVADGLGGAWHAPAILSPRGTIMLDLPLLRDDAGDWARLPRPEQQRLIDAAVSARTEALTLVEVGGAQVPRLGTVSQTVVADWAATLLSAIYPFNVEAFGKLGILTDRLVLEVCLAAAGLQKTA